jgi:hypothetical protein
VAVALTLQRLKLVADRILALAELAGVRNVDGWFAVSDVDYLLEGLRLPPPPDTSAVLSHLKRVKLLRARAAKPPWTVTPEGHARILTVIGELDPTETQREIVRHAGAELAQARHVVLLPQQAPPRWLPAISRLLDRYPFETNVFCMTRFARDEVDPVSVAAAAARSALAPHGLKLHLANDRTVDPELFGNVAAYMWASRYGVALLEDRAGHGLNENVVIEVGAMLMAGRPCALLKDAALERDLPTDLVGHIYKRADLSDTKAVSKTLHRWAAEDLALGACKECLPA